MLGKMQILFCFGKSWIKKYNNNILFFQIKSLCCSSAALIEKPPLITPPVGINNDDSYVKVKP
jgi:hypothetical protein